MQLVKKLYNDDFFVKKRTGLNEMPAVHEILIYICKQLVSRLKRNHGDYVVLLFRQGGLCSSTLQIRHLDWLPKSDTVDYLVQRRIAAVSVLVQIYLPRDVQRF